MRTKMSRARMGDEPNPVDVHVGARVRMYRALRGMSQEGLADAIGITFQQVQKYETGHNRISASRLWDISQVLQTPIELFYQDMADEVSAASPRHLLKSDGAVNSDFSVEQTTKLVDGDPLNRRETLSLIRSYYKIPNRALAHKILELIRMSAYTDAEDETSSDDQDLTDASKKA